MSSSVAVQPRFDRGFRSLRIRAIQKNKTTAQPWLSGRKHGRGAAAFFIRTAQSSRLNLGGEVGTFFQIEYNCTIASFQPEYPMTNTVTLDHVERLAEQLPLPAQLQMVARITQRLNASLFSAAKSAKTSESYAQQIEAFLRLSESQAAETIGEVDSAEDIRALREERIARL